MQMMLAWNHRAIVSERRSGRAPMVMNLEKLSIATMIWLAPPADLGYTSGIKSMLYTYLGRDPTYMALRSGAIRNLTYYSWQA